MSDTVLVLGGTPRRLPAGPAGRARSARVVVAALVVVVAIGYLIYNGFQSTSVYYLTVSELKAKATNSNDLARSDIRVAGIVQDGSIHKVSGDPTVSFTVTDEGGSLPVVYRGLVPDIFAPGIQVVVEGRYVNGVFEASTLLAKCPSKFTSEVPTPIAAK